MGDRKLKNPIVTVVRDGHPDLDLQTTNADMIRWDLTRPRQRPVWPSMTEAPMLWLTFVAWAAAQRTGAIETSYTWETWRDEVLEVSTADEDSPEEAEAEAAGMGSPFLLGPEPG